MKTLTCIMCPIGCQMTAVPTGDGYEFSGHTCKRGVTYAEKELTAPIRVVTSLMPHTSGAVIPCKTLTPIPKSLIFEVLKEIKKGTSLPAVKIGDVLIDNVCGTGSAVVATDSF